MGMVMNTSLLSKNSCNFFVSKKISILSPVVFFVLILWVVNAHSYSLRWDQDVVIPKTGSNNYNKLYGELDQYKQIFIIYAPPTLLPVNKLWPGQTMRIKVLVPPGVDTASISGSSNQWQGQGPNFNQAPQVGVFSDDRGNSNDSSVFFLCPDLITPPALKNSCPSIKNVGNNTKFVYALELHNVTAMMSEALYHEVQETTLAKETYLVIHNPSRSITFELGSLQIQMVVSNQKLYNNWRLGKTPPHDGGKDEPGSDSGGTKDDSKPENDNDNTQNGSNCSPQTIVYFI